MDRKADRGLQVAKRAKRRGKAGAAQRKRCAVHEVETVRTSNDYVVAGQRARVWIEFGVVMNCQCCRR